LERCELNLDGKVRILMITYNVKEDISHVVKVVLYMNVPM
jgi:hypothetical protein